MTFDEFPGFLQDPIIRSRFSANGTNSELYQFDKKEGFNDWKKSYHPVSTHENSPTHKLCVLHMKERSNVLGRIDHALTMQLDEEINYWKNILKRVVACVKALASRGLPFRGHNERFGSIHNGNYLMSLSLSL